MAHDISHLPPDQKKHFRYCEYCKNYFDMRDLGEVLLHAGGDCLTGKRKQRIDYSRSRRVGDPEEFLNDETKTKLDLN